MFKTAHLIVVNKMDIAEAVGYDRETALANLRRVAPGASILEVSSRTGQGMERWYAYLRDHSQRETDHHAPHSRGLGGS